MRFKQIQKSPYHKETHQLEIERLKSRIAQIKNSKIKNTTTTEDKENFLPRINSKHHQSMDIIKRKEVLMQNTRLVKKIAQTKTSHSRYLNQVIGVDTERLAQKQKKQTKKHSASKILLPTKNEIVEDSASLVVV